MLYKEPHFRVLGDRGLLIEFGNSINRETKERLSAMETIIAQRKIDGVIETIPGYCSLSILFDPLKLCFEDLVNKVKDLSQCLSNTALEKPRTVKVPVVYGRKIGPDLEFVAKFHNLTPAEVIRIHSSVTYTVYVMGTTGFAYLGDLPEELHTPRLETPRSSVPAGSIGIGNNQTGIYAVEGPSGWQWIGKTSLQIYDPSKEFPVLLRPNDNVLFTPVE